MANGAMTSNTKGEKSARQHMVDNSMVDAIVRLPDKLFLTTGIPACLFILSKNRDGRDGIHRERTNEILFIDASKMGTMASRKLRVFDDKDIKKIGDTYHHWRSTVDRQSNSNTVIARNSPPFEEEYPQGEVVNSPPFEEEHPEGNPTNYSPPFKQEHLEGNPTNYSPPFKGGVPEGRGGSFEGAIPSEGSGSFEAGGVSFNNLPHLKTFRKKLRNNATPAEATLWTLLSGKKLDGRKFRRQHSVANYILDFYCPAEKLAIELDGEGHNDIIQADYDNERDLFLNHCGIKVLRFENKEVYDHPESLLESIKKEFGWHHNHPALQAPLLEKEGNAYQNQPGFCKSATLAEVQKQDYKLTPGIYVGTEAEVDDGIPFEVKMEGLKTQLMGQFERSNELQKSIAENLKRI
jgi:very-short-patch-repair endonuclease